MELEERPNSHHAPMMQQAQERAHACIESDPTRALQRIDVKTPGNYRPESEHLQIEQNKQLCQSMAGPLTTLQPVMGPSTTTAGDRSQSCSCSMHPDDVQSQEAPLNYGMDEDIQMGPALG